LWLDVSYASTVKVYVPAGVEEDVPIVNVEVVTDEVREAGVKVIVNPDGCEGVQIVIERVAVLLVPPPFQVDVMLYVADEPAVTGDGD